MAMSVKAGVFDPEMMDSSCSHLCRFWNAPILAALPPNFFWNGRQQSKYKKLSAVAAFFEGILLNALQAGEEKIARVYFRKN